LQDEQLLGTQGGLEGMLVPLLGSTFPH